jgi:dTDP-4-amino-4,6-dideoxygalactose transaminase
VHYVPVHLMPYYQQFGFKKGDFPNAESYYEKCLSIPMYHSLTNEDQDLVIETILNFTK